MQLGIPSGDCTPLAGADRHIRQCGRGRDRWRGPDEADGGASGTAARAATLLRVVPRPAPGNSGALRRGHSAILQDQDGARVRSAHGARSQDQRRRATQPKSSCVSCA